MRKRHHTKRAEKVSIPMVRVNEKITAKEVRLLNSDGSQHGIVPTFKALKMSEAAELDLVEIFAKAEPPVCRIMNYSKYVFDTTKRKIQSRKNLKLAEQKTIKFRPNTSDGDYNIKKRKILEFLERGHRVKILVWFRGREMAHQELGMQMLKKIKTDIIDHIRIEDEPKLEGRQVTMTVSSLTHKKSTDKKNIEKNDNND